MPDPQTGAGVPDLDVETLLAPQPGPYGGLPPFDRASPKAIGMAVEIAIGRKRAEIRRIADCPDPPTFANTIEALEDSGHELSRAECLFSVFSGAVSSDEMRDVERRIVPLRQALNDEIAHDEGLWARVEAVHAADGLSDEQRRLVMKLRGRLRRRGAGLPADRRGRLAEINSRIATLFSEFNANLMVEQDGQHILLGDPADLEGMPEGMREAAAAAAKALGHPGQWAISNTRPAVWSFLTNSPRRELRERAWRMWTSRGANPGPRDNRPIVAEIARLRGEKARLLGFPTYAHFATDERMIVDPGKALDLLSRVWAPVRAVTIAQVAELQGLADAEGADFPLAPWDRLYYAERLRRSRFGVDAGKLREYLELESTLAGIFWAAERMYGFGFKRLSEAPVWHPEVRAYEVSRAGRIVGVLWLDLMYRPGKQRGSWQQLLRQGSTFRGLVLPFSCVFSGVPRPSPGEPVLLPWEYANVLFHEIGHALHSLSYAGAYPSLGAQAVEWDFIELPSMLNERCFGDRSVLERFARHFRSGEPIPPALLEGLERATRYDRTVTLTVDLLSVAIADLRLYLLADGRELDPCALEDEVLRELDMPMAGDPMLRMPHAYHTFSEEYAAGVYSYLWADVMAADVAEIFAGTRGGLFDQELCGRFFRAILSRGAIAPAAAAFRDFAGRDPDPGALLRRYGLDMTGG